MMIALCIDIPGIAVVYPQVMSRFTLCLIIMGEESQQHCSSDKSLMDQGRWRTLEAEAAVMVAKEIDGVVKYHHQQKKQVNY